LRADPSATATISDPGGSSGADPIKPILVKTVSVKAGGNQVVTAVPSAMVPAQTIVFPPPLTASPVKTARVEPLSPPPSATTESPAATPQAAANPAPMPSKSEAPRAPAPSRPDALGVLTVASASAAEMPPVDSALGAKHAVRGGWLIQVGAFEAEREAKERLSSAQSRAKDLLGAADPFTERVVKGDKSLYRARFAGLDKEGAEAACRALKRNDIACISLKN
jgi:D-alanyl-D-alanine carboxypeptidase